jgi:hypothetical protein
MNHIADHMLRIQSTVVAKQVVANTVCIVISDTVGFAINPGWIVVSGRRIRVTAPPSLRHIIFLRKEELLKKINNRLGGDRVETFE